MISIEVVDNETECERLWKTFCQDPDFWNLWEVRKCFHTPRYRLHFIQHVENGAAVSLLPLVYDKKWGCYTYFGAYYPENNRIMLRDRRYANELISSIPLQSEIYHLNEEDAKLNVKIKKSDKHYFINWGDCHTFEDFLARFSKKHRKNLKNDLKKIESLDLTVVRNHAADFEQLIRFNQERFGKDSDYHDATILHEMRSLFRFVNEKKMLDLISVFIDKKIAGIAFGIVYKGIYYSINTGRDTTIENLGKFLVCEQIKAAHERGCKKIDFLTGDDPWKELWNLEWEDTYELIT